MKNTEKHIQGFTLLFGLLLASFLLAVALSMLGFSARQVGISGIGRDSQSAFYAADSLAECIRSLDEDMSFSNENAIQNSKTVTCNNVDITVRHMGTLQCNRPAPSRNDDEREYCPDTSYVANQGGTGSYHYFNFDEAKLSNNAQTPQSALAVLVKHYDAIGNGRDTTVSVYGRNTMDANARKVERALKMTYLPNNIGLQCPQSVYPRANEQLSDSAATYIAQNTIDQGQNQNDTIIVNAYAVRCTSDQFFPKIANELERGNSTDFITSNWVKNHVDNMNATYGAGTCSYEPKCFEWGFAGGGASSNAQESIQISGTLPSTNIRNPSHGGVHAGAAKDTDWYGGLRGNNAWRNFNTSADVAGNPAILGIQLSKTQGSSYVADSMVQIRTVRGENDLPFVMPYGEPNIPSSSTTFPPNAYDVVSSEFLCHLDQTNFDNVEGIHGGGHLSGYGWPAYGGVYTCASFTADASNYTCWESATGTIGCARRY